jgi:hypothetical protein
MGMAVGLEVFAGGGEVVEEASIAIAIRVVMRHLQQLAGMLHWQLLTMLCRGTQASLLCCRAAARDRGFTRNRSATATRKM